MTPPDAPAPGSSPRAAGGRLSGAETPGNSPRTAEERLSGAEAPGNSPRTAGGRLSGAEAPGNSPRAAGERLSGAVGRPLLVVTAVAAESDAIRAVADPRRVRAEPVGVGPAAAAAGTARLLATGDYRGVISAGIAGGFAGRAPVGATVLATRSIAADLGAESPGGFLPIEELGFGTSVLPVDPLLLKALTEALTDAVVGDVLTLATVTGTAETAERLAARFPEAAAEAMEGFGVATAAQHAGLPFAEVRTVSNPIGPRDRDAWRLPEALAALRAAFTTFTP